MNRRIGHRISLAVDEIGLFAFSQKLKARSRFSSVRLPRTCFE
jgi:hypothetical protein